MSRARLRAHLRVALFGAALGFTLSRIGVTDFGEIDRMLALADPRLFLVFMGAVSLCMVGLAGLLRGQAQAKRKIHAGAVPGAVIFGIGWAITGVCPAVALVQLGGGQVHGLWALAGIVLGTWAYGKGHARFFRWDPGSCEL